MKHNFQMLVLWLGSRVNELTARVELGEDCGDELICNVLEKIRLTQIMNGEIKDD